MQKQLERLTQIFTKRQNKKAGDKCLSGPQEWSYWEQTEASLREAMRAWDNECRKNGVREVA
jgi:hypothetical protein